MPEFFFLGPQVFPVLLIGRNLDRKWSRNPQAVAVQTDDLLRVVGQETNLPAPKVHENLGADAVVTQVGAEAQTFVGFDGIQPLFLLEPVSLQLTQEADAAAFLTHVENHAFAGLAAWR